jgi:outer membrane autotransporter protein
MPRLRARAYGLAATFALTLAEPAAAQTQTVTSTDSLGPGTLHQAVNNAVVDGTVIDFSLPAVPPPTIVILPPNGNNPGPLEARVDLTIDGTTAPGLTIQSQDVRETLIVDDDPDVDDDIEVRLIDVNQGLGTIKVDGTLIFETRTDVSVTSQIADVDSIASGGASDQFGTLRKQGEATLFLNEATSYSGDTIIEEGILQAKSQAVQGDIQNGSTLIIDAELLTTTYRGSISDLDVDDPGAVEKIGVGRVTMEDAQTYTGGTIIRSGNLTLDSSGGAIGALDSASDVTVEAGATLEFKLGTGMPGTYTGTWDSAGEVILEGEDELAILDLSGADANLRGDITVNQGRLDLRASAIGGDITLRDANSAMAGDTPNGAVLHVLGGGNVGRAISGDGRVEVDAGAETLTLSGVNTYTGSTTLLSGTLMVNANSMPGNAEVQAGTNLVFDQGGTGVYDGILSGAGAVEKSGSGTLTMSGTHLLSGAFRVSAGTLDLGDMALLPGDLSVDAGAFLSGGGTIGGLTSIMGGVTPLDLRVGQATFSTGSRLDFTLDPAATTRQLLVDASGSVVLESGTLIGLNVLSGDYDNMGNGVDFTLINGDAGAVITNNGVLLDGEFAFLDVTIVPSAANLFIINVLGSIEEDDLLDAAETPNQRSVAGALFDVIEDPAGATVREALLTVSAEDLPAVYDDAGGESISAFTSAALATAQRFERGLHRRVRDLSWGSRESYFSFGPNPAPNLGPTSSNTRLRAPSGVLAAPLAVTGTRPAPGIGMWSDVWGVLGSIDGDGNSSDTDTNLAGVSLAADARIDRHGLVGVAVGYTFADIDVDGQDTNSDAHGIQTALYGGWSTQKAYLSGTARFAWARNDSERDLVVGTATGTTRADFDTLDYGLGFELGANLARLGLVLVQPVASFDWVRVERESFSESAGGALGPLALSVDDDTTESLRSGLGLRASLRYPLDTNSEMVPELRARWLHEFGDEERIVRGRFRGAPAGGGAFRVKGAEAGSDTFLAGLGWSVSLGERFRVHADYDALVSSDALAHELSIAIRARY